MQITYMLPRDCTDWACWLLHWWSYSTEWEGCTVRARGLRVLGLQIEHAKGTATIKFY